MARRTAQRRAAVLTSAIAVGAMLVAALAPAAGAAVQPACRVKNPTQGTWFATQDGRALTRAIAAANSGDRLNVFGTCRGNFVIDKNLRVFGNPQASAPTVLDGRGSGRVLTVLPRLVGTVTVTLARLVVTGGGEGGIEVGEGTVVALNNSTVRGNSSATSHVGGGIANGGDLTLNNTTVTGNRAVLDGGGIFNFGDLTLNRSRLTRNTAGGGGGGLFSEGVAVLNFSRVTGNTAAFGGGILSVNTLTLNSTVVSGNVPDDCAC